LDEAAVRSWEDLNLGDALEAEVGSTQVVAHSPDTPPTRGSGASVCKVGWRDGNSTIRYRMST
jgi:hypothetical protein